MAQQVNAQPPAAPAQPAAPAYSTQNMERFSKTGAIADLEAALKDPSVLTVEKAKTALKLLGFKALKTVGGKKEVETVGSFINRNDMVIRQERLNMIVANQDRINEFRNMVNASYNDTAKASTAEQNIGIKRSAWYVGGATPQYNTFMLDAFKPFHNNLDSLLRNNTISYNVGGVSAQVGGSRSNVAYFQPQMGGGTEENKKFVLEAMKNLGQTVNSETELIALLDKITAMPRNQQFLPLRVLRDALVAANKAGYQLDNYSALGNLIQKYINVLHSNVSVEDVHRQLVETEFIGKNQVPTSQFDLLRIGNVLTEVIRGIEGLALGEKKAIVSLS